MKVEKDGKREKERKIERKAVKDYEKQEEEHMIKEGKLIGEGSANHVSNRITSMKAAKKV